MVSCLQLQMYFVTILTINLSYIHFPSSPPPLGERPFVCPLCSMAFTTNGNMHRHLRIHEREGTTTAEEIQEKYSGKGNRGRKRKSANAVAAAANGEFIFEGKRQCCWRLSTMPSKLTQRCSVVKCLCVSALRTVCAVVTTY